MRTFIIVYGYGVVFAEEEKARIVEFCMIKIN